MGCVVCGLGVCVCDIFYFKSFQGQQNFVHGSLHKCNVFQMFYWFHINVELFAFYIVSLLLNFKTFLYNVVVFVSCEAGPCCKS